MHVFNLIFFTTLIGTSWCGLILHNIRDSLHSKIYGHGLESDAKQNSPVININNHQQVFQAPTPINQLQPHHQQQHQYGLNQRGDYGSLPSSGRYHSFGGAHDMESNFKAGGLKYHQGENSYDSHAMGSGFGGGVSHHMMKQESYNHRNGPKFGHHHDNNMFGNTQDLGAASNGGESSSLSSSSSSSSSVVASSSSSSSSISNGGKPWIRRY